MGSGEVYEEVLCGRNSVISLNVVVDSVSVLLADVVY
jgi:hypothetical protein